MEKDHYAYVITMKYVPRERFEEIMEYIESLQKVEEHDHFVLVNYSYSNRMGKHGTLELMVTKEHYPVFVDLMAFLSRDKNKEESL